MSGVDLNKVISIIQDEIDVLEKEMGEYRYESESWGAYVTNIRQLARLIKKIQRTATP